MKRQLICAVAICLFGMITDGVAQEKDSASKKGNRTAEEKSRFDKFEKSMSGVKLVGSFTIDGRDNKLREEEYVIESVTKTDEGNLWLFKARIKYGNINVMVPMVIPVEWAGETPMVSLSDFKIPLVGSGSFGARVLFHENKYCGTWNHDAVGGHLFGRIEKIKVEKKERKKRDSAK